MEIMEIKQRPRRGGKGGRPPMSDEKRRAIVALYNSDTMTCKEASAQLGVSTATFYRAIRKEKELIALAKAEQCGQTKV